MSHQDPLYQQIQTRDVVLMALLPLITVSIYQLPLSTRKTMVFSYNEPSIKTAFTSAFVHLDAAHLLQNLLLYTLVIISIYTLCLTARSRQHFRVFVVSVLTAFPFVLSYVNLGIARSSLSFGSSGLVMAFAGYLPFALAIYLRGRLGIGKIRTLAPIFFFPTLALISVLSLQSVLRTNTTALFVVVGLVAATLLATLWYIISAYEQSWSSDRNARNVIATRGGPELAGAALLVLLGVLFISFPADPTIDNGILNIYEHFIGYSLGFILSFTTSQITARIGEIR